MKLKKREIKERTSDSTLNKDKVRFAVKSVHVYPKDGTWAVRASGSSRDASRYTSKSDAVNRGREIARKRKNGLVVHNRNGKIKFRDSYGKDPFPPKE
ncbi:MAG: DUF2188 domain-containing protein [Balneola sp.]